MQGEIIRMNVVVRRSLCSTYLLMIDIDCFVMAVVLPISLTLVLLRFQLCPGIQHSHINQGIQIIHT